MNERSEEQLSIVY